jgi:hypothetical protein
MIDQDTRAADLARIKSLHEKKKSLEAELSNVREEWRAAMFEAREHGVTVSDISREIGVVAPNIFRVLRDGK